MDKAIKQNLFIYFTQLEKEYSNYCTKGEINYKTAQMINSALHRYHKKVLEAIRMDEEKTLYARLDKKTQKV